MLIISNLTKAQSPQWEWARMSGGSFGRFISSDIYENIYLAGRIDLGVTYFGGIPYVCTGGLNGCGFLAKYDSSGNFIWAKSETAPGSGNCIVNAVHADIFGNSYLTGIFKDTIIFDSDTLISLTHAAFIAKFSTTGNVIWAKNISSEGNISIYKLTTDSDGKIFMTGSFQATLQLGPDTIFNSGIADVFIAKSDSAGEIIWARSAGGTDLENGKGIALDGSANVYITGEFKSQLMHFGTYSLNNPGTGRVPYIAKYDSSGNFKWVKIGYVISYNNGGEHITTDQSSNIYMSGIFYSPTIVFNNIMLTKSGGGSNAFIIKYDSSGNVLWAKSVKAIGTGNIENDCIVADNFGRVYMTGAYGNSFMDNTSAVIGSYVLPHPPGSFSDPMYIIAFDTSGSVHFAESLESGGRGGNSITPGPSGAVYVGATYSTTDSFFVIGPDTFPGNLSGPFVAKLVDSGTTTDLVSLPEKEAVFRNIFPNPFDTKLYIQTMGIEAFEIKLFDLSSRELIRQIFTSSTSIETASLAKGFYILQIVSRDGEIFTSKVVKE